MHEQSLVESLLRQAESLRCQHGAERISEVRVEIGPLAGVEPLLLTSAFELLTPGSTAGGAKLVIDDVPLSARCDSCDVDFEVNGFVFRCAKCGGPVDVISGDELLLVSVSLQSGQPVRERVS